MSAFLTACGHLDDDPRELGLGGVPAAAASLAVCVEPGDGDGDGLLRIEVLALGRPAGTLLHHRRGEVITVSGRLLAVCETLPDGTRRERLGVVADAIASARTVGAAGHHRRAPTKGG